MKLMLVVMALSIFSLFGQTPMPSGDGTPGVKTTHPIKWCNPYLDLLWWLRR